MLANELETKTVTQLKMIPQLKMAPQLKEITWLTK